MKVTLLFLLFNKSLGLDLKKKVLHCYKTIVFQINAVHLNICNVLDYPEDDRQKHKETR